MGAAPGGAADPAPGSASAPSGSGGNSDGDHAKLVRFRLEFIPVHTVYGRDLYCWLQVGGLVGGLVGFAVCAALVTAFVLARHVSRLLAPNYRRRSI